MLEFLRRGALEESNEMSSRVVTMGTITGALERSLQKCSLSSHHQPDHHQPLSSDSSSHASSNNININSNNNININNNNNTHPSSIHQTPTLDLNSHLSLPYHWEQCLDLKTGEIYYINWRNGMKAKEDPRSTTEDDDLYSEDYSYYYSDDDDDSSSYDSEESSTESSNNNRKKKFVGNIEEEEEEVKDKDVLVVGGCKRCLMYLMVPKHLEDCPKCNGQLLHFDRSENDIP